jgi:hypothetical protein
MLKLRRHSCIKPPRVLDIATAAFLEQDVTLVKMTVLPTYPLCSADTPSSICQVTGGGIPNY